MLDLQRVRSRAMLKASSTGVSLLFEVFGEYVAPARDGGSPGLDRPSALGGICSWRGHDGWRETGVEGQNSDRKSGL